MTKKERRKMNRETNNAGTCKWILTCSGRTIEIAGKHSDRVQFFKKWGYDNKWSEYMAFMSEHTDKLVTAR